jgi:16S rRNA (adenine1518-N6/adenine1519-N6)-dimethyltransferase
MSRLLARKGLGQHFLHDPAVIDRIIATIDPRPDDNMVEIGGGEGALTRPLIERLNQLHVVEADPRLVPVLTQLAPPSQLIVHEGDALKFELDGLASGPGTLRVVGNLPYNISTPLLFHFLRFRDAIRDLHLMLQKEVAERIAARPNSKKYGRLTVMLAAWTDIELCFDIGPGAFRPPPKVWSTFLRITPRSKPRFEIEDQAAFARLVAHAFSMRRKTLRRILKGKISESEILAAGFDPTLRPENLEPEDFARLSKLTG